jgi:hypothetical protein
MWWDLIPIGGQPDSPDHTDLDREILGVMESTLRIDSVPCQESALHGLGHWHLQYPQRVEGIIETFLKEHGKIREELQRYAINAARGCIL